MGMMAILDGDCIIDDGGNVIYDDLEDMSRAARLRLAELSTEHEEWGWIECRAVLEAEGLYHAAMA
jgi:hypothetical protein